MGKPKRLNLILLLVNLTLLSGIFWVVRLSVSSFQITDNSEVIVDKLTIVQFDNLSEENNNITIQQYDNEVVSSSEIKMEDVPELLPSKMNLDVPFTSQAPEKNWDQPWQDACEEAAVLMLDAYYKGYGLSPLFSKDEILKMVDWQDERGWGYSIEAEKVLKLTDWYMSSKQIRIVEDPSVEEIKEFVASGNPVLILAYGKDLPNTHFSGDGPEYHALIIRGYNEQGFYTNDPGTRNGENFFYTYENLMDSIHDWNGGDVTADPWVTKSPFPETGSVFQMITTKPNSASDVFTLQTGDMKPQAKAVQVADVNVWPNPYFGYNPEERNPIDQRMHFTHLPESGSWKIRIFDLAGNHIRTLNGSSVGDGTQFSVWDLRNDFGVPVASGMYIAHVESGGKSKILKLAVVQPEQRLDRY